MSSAKKLKDKNLERKIQRNGVTTANRFEALATVENDKPNERKSTPIAPITITDSTKNPTDIINNLKITFKNKITSIGKKFYVNSIDDKQKIIETLKQQNIEFFTHPDATEKTFKTVISGLPDLEIGELETILKEENNLLPTKIIKMGSESHRLYLLHFNFSDVTLNDVKQIKVIYYHIVRWLSYKPKRRGPTQCWRCLMWGHGKSQCNRKTCCMICGDEHDTKECRHYKPKNDTEAAQVVFKCFNCSNRKLPCNHRADDPSCPCRTDYVNIRANGRSNNSNSKKKLSNKTPKHTSSNNTNKQTKVTLQARQQNDCPRPLQANKVDWNGRVENNYRQDRNINYRPFSWNSLETPHTIPQTPKSSRARSFADATKQHPKQLTLQQPSSPNSNMSLLSFQEIANILTNSVQALSKCRTRLDQANVIVKIFDDILNS